MKMPIVALALVFASTALWAANSPDSNAVVVTLQVRKVVLQKDGKELLVDTAAAPGDVLEYQATYTNRGPAVARGVTATLPVPEAAGVEYVDASAPPRNVLASVDGKQFAPAPLQQEVRLPDGRRKTEAVPLAAYRFLRWQLGDLNAGQSIVVYSRMRLIAPFASNLPNSQ